MKVPKTLVPDSDPVLHTPAAAVDTKDSALLKDLSAGLDRVLKRGSGVGLALPQVGVGLRGFVLRDILFVPQWTRTCFNPRIVEASPEIEPGVEGCLSLPGRRYEVSRHKSVRVEYTDAKGQLKNETFRGLPARAFQHELDHLDGKMISRFPEVGAPKPAREQIAPLTPPNCAEPAKPIAAVAGPGE